jgi:hypothetical protein
MAINSTPAALDSNIWMATDEKPDEVIDMEDGRPVPFVAENSGITISSVHFDGYGVRTFAIRRTTLAGAIPIWWHEKTTYWKRTQVEVAAERMVLPPPKDCGDLVIPLNQWHFHTDEDHQISAKNQWTSVEFRDTDWKSDEGRPWNYFDPALKDYHGMGLYRAKFTIPPSWDNHLILLNLYDFNSPIVYDSAEFAVNGRHVVTYKARGGNQTCNCDVTSLVHPGENLLTVEANGGTALGGLSGSVWIEARVPLSPALPLTGIWRAIQGDWLTSKNVAVPAAAPLVAKYLTREIDIPTGWKGKSVCVEWAAKEQWVGGIVINGHPITCDAPIHPFGLMPRINVSTCIKPGESNVIEIWPVATMTNQGSAEKKEVKGFLLDSMSLGCDGQPH